jgi:PAS domain S-box-containing protein
VLPQDSDPPGGHGSADGSWFRRIADEAPIVMWTTDRSGACTYLNGAWYAYTGQTEAEATGGGWLDAVHADDRAQKERLFEAASSARKAFRLEYRLRRADGAYRWAIDLARPRFDAAGAFLGFVGSVIDIHVRRQAEERLRQSEARLKAVFSTVPVGISIAEAQTGRIIAGNPQIERIFGRPIPLGDDNGPPGGWSAFHADGRRVEPAEYPVARAAASGEPAEGEYHYERQDGSRVWVRAIATPIRDADTDAVAA